jgi:hypothetical protein
VGFLSDSMSLGAAIVVFSSFASGVMIVMLLTLPETRGRRPQELGSRRGRRGRCAASGARHASDATHPAVDDGGSKGKGTRPQKLGDFVCDGRKGPARADSPAEERAAPRLRRVGDNVLREGNIGLVRAQHLGEIGM